MENRYEINQIYFNFVTMIKTQFSYRIKVFRTDNVMEYKSEEFLNFLHKNGIISHYSCPNTSQQNDHVERKHKHILKTTRALIISKSCFEIFWGKATFAAIYTINHVPSSIIGNQTHFECLFGVSLYYNLLKKFGYACFVLLQSHEKTKLEPHAHLDCFLGYGIEHK